MSKRVNPYAALSRIFHEPNRLAIVSALCNVEEGVTFGELREECRLTDGNLSRHLKTLEEARTVRVKKSFVKGRPLTRIFLTERGRNDFIGYLQALEEVLQRAAESLAAQETEATLPFSPARLRNA